MTQAIAKSFHAYSDDELIYYRPRKAGVVVTTETKHIITQERTVSYRFYLHQHPYVQQLAKRLIEKSIAGLQAADTEYTVDGASLPGTIELALGSNTGLSIPSDTQIVLLADLQATLPGGALITLSANTQVNLASAALATLPDGMSATLLDGITGTPSVGAVFNLAQDMAAVVVRETTITLSLDTQITLQDGTQATIAGSTQVLLLSGTQLTVPNGTQVTLLRSQPRPVLYADIFSATRYNASALVQRPYPVKDLDFTYSGAYSVYNWELFFHVPLTLAIHLSKNGRYAEAQQWFHYIFDPTDDSNGPTPERFWKVRPFQSTDVKKIEEILLNLATDADPQLRTATVRSIEAWKDAPFRPHVIARYRQQAYMFKTVMAYLDNLIAWGDSLFRQDTGESINEAMIVYVLAANLLGPRPQVVPKKGAVRPQTYANLRADLDKFGNAMRDLEADTTFDLMPHPTEAADNERLALVRGLSKALYFCVPRNDKLLSYWDTVADRLFKIRNSLNLQGIFRQLPLFEPPIDPALLARAAAAGLDVGAVVNGLNQPLPLVRFQLLVQKASEIVQEVKSLGNNLLSAMEKEDGEAMAILRAKHERIVMEMVEHVKYGQLQEAVKAKEGLLTSLATAVHRYTYYERQLGKKADEIIKAIPALVELDKDGLDKMKFSMEEPKVEPREIEVDIAQGLEGISGGKKISKHESEEMNKLGEAREKHAAAARWDKRGAETAVIPDFGAYATPIGVGANTTVGGRNFIALAQMFSTYHKSAADELSYQANTTAKIGSYARREQDWAFQSNLAAGEISQIFKQLRGAQIREAIAELELKNHRQQIQHAQEVEHFLNEEGTQKTGKKTNKALYTWMKREVKGLYGQCFQFAFDIAKKAERALQHELGNPQLVYLQFGYLAGKEGLLAGEKLYFDIKRMEMAYHDLNEREYELTKHVSLMQVNPFALLQLRATGRCTVALPEELFDMDGPGHYFRRIKTLAVSIPCVTGSYTSVNCTLTLLKSSIRKNALLREGVYARDGNEDDRFSEHFGSLQSVVTSSGQNDSGLFETNLHDERKLPFEYSGAISEWQLELPAAVRQFDYDTISDVILHMRYTAREGGGLLRNGAASNLKAKIEAAQAAGSVRLFSVRHEFPTAWAKFKSVQMPAAPTAELAFTFEPGHYPFWSQAQDRLQVVARLDLFAKSTSTTKNTIAVSQLQPDGTQAQDDLVKDNALNGLRVGKLNNIPRPLPVGPFKLSFDDNSMEDLWLAVTWGKEI